jgi:hypothetical protein
MEDGLAAIVSRIENGSSEERIAALDEYGRQFSVVIAAATRALVTDDAARLFIADRIMRLAHVVQGALLLLDLEAASVETKFLRALILCQFGDRGEVPFLVTLASGSGPYQYDAMRQLAFLRVSEVRVPILNQLRMLDLSNADVITGLLHAWKLFGDPLPDDLRLRLSGDGIPDGVRVAMKALKF